MYTYTPERKSKIEKVIKAFEPYILQSDFFDILWSNKFGYLLVKSRSEEQSDRKWTK